MIRPGEAWGAPATGPPDLDVSGGDADLALAVSAHPGALIRFSPESTSDIARAVGLGAGRPTGQELPVDALSIDGDGLATNMVVAGTAPDRLRRFSRRIFVSVTVDGREWFTGRATTVVIATGQFLRGLDVVPRGHPGDGRAEVQVYTPTRGEAAAVRARLGSGTHVPHPRISQRSGRQVEVRFDRPQRLEIDGIAAPNAASVTIAVAAAAYRLLV